MIGLVGYRYSQPLHKPGKDHLYTYITAANGLFIYAKRQGLEVLLPLETFREPIRGIEPLEPMLRLPWRVPFALLNRMVSLSRRAMPNEALFYLDYTFGWKLRIPGQMAGRSMVKPEDDYPEDAVLIEIHSHNSMDAFFSETDNRDETGFRIYGVLGKINTDRPEIRLRVGVYGQHVPVRVKDIFGG
jgi:PRTRC genetic system protein A